MAQTEEFMFQNVAYRPTVYRTEEKCKNQFEIFKVFLNELGIKEDILG